jgi:hypothetical protein
LAREEEKMRKLVSGRGLLAVLLVAAACGGGYESVQIAVPDDFAAGVERAAPGGKYRILAAAAGAPASAAEMAEGKLVVCGEMEEHADIRIMMLSAGGAEGTPFASVHHFFVNPMIVSEGCGMRFSEDLNAQREEGGSIQFHRQKEACGKDTPDAELAKMCFDALRETEHSVMLAAKGMNLGDPGELVEIDFTS